MLGFVHEDCQLEGTFGLRWLSGCLQSRDHVIGIAFSPLDAPLEVATHAKLIVPVDLLICRRCR